MKRIFWAAAACTLAACSFLDTDVYGHLNEENLYQEEKTCMAGLAGIYDKLGAEGLYGLNLWGNLDAGTDLLVYNRGYGVNDARIDLYNYNNTHSDIERTWKDLYEGINRANDYIELIGSRSEEACGGARDKRMYLAEAKGLRALFYLNLVAFWGEVPLRLTPARDLSGQQLARSPQADIYAQILSDLHEAEAGCLPADELQAPGRMSQTTAQALLARAYMWQAGYPVGADTWDEALGWARKVKESGLHRLRTASADGTNGYRALFIDMCSDRYDLTWRESMFEVEFFGNGVSTDTDEAGMVGLYLGVMNMCTTDPDVPYAYGWWDGSRILFRLYEENDARKWWNFADYTYTTVGEKAVKTPVDKAAKRDGNPGKWRAEYIPVRPWARNQSSINFPIMRYSDVLLMIAECANRVNGGPTQEAVDALNEVRRRAEASTVALSDFAGMEDFEEFVREERARELCFEVPRHMELRRCGEEYFYRRIRLLADQSYGDDGERIGYEPANNKSLPGLQLDRRHIYLPIPQAELNTNPACGQNELW